MKLMFAGLLLGAAIVIRAEYVRSAEAAADISHLIQQLRDSDIEHRREAVGELGKISPLPPKGINAMASLLAQQNQDPLIENLAQNALCVGRRRDSPGPRVIANRAPTREFRSILCYLRKSRGCMVEQKGFEPSTSCWQMRGRDCQVSPCMV
jgi:hypothetical protein